MRVGLLGAVLVLVLASGARAEDGALPDPAALLAGAEEAERTGDVAAALRGYRAVLDAAPTSRLAGRAQRRLDWLEARDDDPDALSALLAYRARPSRTLADVEAFEARALEMPAGLVRLEALVVVAGELDGLAARDGDATLVARAEDAYRRALSEPGLGPSEREQLVAGYAAMLGREGRRAEALLLMQTERHESGNLRRRLELEAIDRWLRPLAYTALLLLTLCALGLTARAVSAGHGATLARPGGWRLQVAVVVWGSVGPYLLGLWYSHEAEHLATSLSLALACVLVLAALAGRASEVHPAPSAISRVTVFAAVAAALAAGYLSIYGAPDGPLAH
jgi:hypothetical protein